MTPEQEQLLIQTIARLEQGQEDLQQVVMETRGDMAQFTEWAGIMTQAVEELRASRARHDQLLASLVAGQQQQQAILNELIRQREERNGK